MDITKEQFDCLEKMLIRKLEGMRATGSFHCLSDLSIEIGFKNIYIIFVGALKALTEDDEVTYEGCLSNLKLTHLEKEALDLEEEAELEAKLDLPSKPTQEAR